MAKVFETTVDSQNYDVVWSDTLRGPQIDAVMSHNTETPAHVDFPTMEKIQARLALDIVLQDLIGLCRRMREVKWSITATSA